MRTRRLAGRRCDFLIRECRFLRTEPFDALALKFLELHSFSRLLGRWRQITFPAMGWFRLALVILDLKTVPMRADPFMLAPLNIVRPK